METVASIQWLKENSLYDKSKEISSILKKVLPNCLGIKDEKLLVIGDRGYQNRQIASLLSCAYYLAADDLNIDTKLILQDVKPRGEEAEGDVIRALESLDDGGILILSLSDKLGSLGDIGKSFRKYCLKRKFKFVSALSLGDLNSSSVNDIIQAIDINYKGLKMQQDNVKKILDEGNDIIIKTKAGTELYAEIKGRSALTSDGDYSLPGTGGNLPAGEVYIPPTKKVDGTVVIDGSARNHKHTNIIKDPITLFVEKGSIVSIEGGEEAKLLERTLEWASQNLKRPGSIRRIGEIGIGFNPNAKIIGSTLVDEKALGTAHIGIGSNYWFGGDVYAKLHLDQVFKNPEIEVDDKKI